MHEKRRKKKIPTTRISGNTEYALQREGRKPFMIPLLTFFDHLEIIAFEFSACFFSFLSLPLLFSFLFYSFINLVSATLASTKKLNKNTQKRNRKMKEKLISLLVYLLFGNDFHLKILLNYLSVAESNSYSIPSDSIFQRHIQISEWDNAFALNIFSV